MATITLMLKHGLTIGETVHREAELREIRAGDILEGTAEAERAVQLPDGSWQLLRSPILATVAMLRRRLMRIGDFTGPFTTELMRRMHASDFAMLCDAADALDSASLELTAQRAGEPGAAPPPP